MSTRRSRSNVLTVRWSPVDSQSKLARERANKTSAKVYFCAMNNSCSQLYVNRTNSTTTRLKLQSFIEIKTDESRSAHTASNPSIMFSDFHTQSHIHCRSQMNWNYYRCCCCSAIPRRIPSGMWASISLIENGHYHHIIWHGSAAATSLRVYIHIITLHCLLCVDVIRWKMMQEFAIQNRNIHYSVYKVHHPHKTRRTLSSFRENRRKINFWLLLVLHN